MLTHSFPPKINTLRNGHLRLFTMFNYILYMHVHHNLWLSMNSHAFVGYLSLDSIRFYHCASSRFTGGSGWIPEACRSMPCNSSPSHQPQWPSWLWKGHSLINCGNGKVVFLFRHKEVVTHFSWGGCLNQVCFTWGCSQRDWFRNHISKGMSQTS